MSTAATAVEATTVTEAFRRTVAAQPDAPAVRTADASLSLTWAELSARVDAVARGLHRLGVRRGDAVALLLQNRPEFQVADLAVMTLGATPFSIYTTSSAEQIAYVAGDSGARVAIAEASLVGNLLAAREELPALEHVVLVDGDDAPAGTTPLAEVEDTDGAVELDLDAIRAEVGEDDLLTLIYTSGTTGPPKGVELTHRNLLSVARAANEMLPFGEGGKVISWLPAAHVAERGAHHYAPILFGWEIVCCPDPKGVVALLPQVRPTWFFAVPRIWEKLKAGLEAMLASQPEEQSKPLRDALDAAIEKVRLEQRGEAVPAELAEQVAAADAEIFSGLRGMLGLDEVKSVNVGAAPTPVEVLEFFHAIGIPLGEVWGMSETAAIATINPPGRMKLGTVGVAVEGVEIKLAEDGEVLVRGASIMRGYRNQPEKTAETIDPDGWLLTGDLGELDDEGYLRIVDRKKELIINAAGKNMSPANIEAALKVASPLIGHACVVGDSRPYNVALLVLDPDFGAAWAAKHGLEGADPAVLAADERVRAALQEGVDRANARLSRVEQVKKFHVVPSDWQPGGDELTPTMKLKRRPIAEKYTAEVEALYAG